MDVIKVVLSDGTSVSHGSPSSAVTAVNALFPNNVFEAQRTCVRRTIISQRIHGSHVAVVSATGCSSSPQISRVSRSIRVGRIGSGVSTKSALQEVECLSVFASVGVAVGSQSGWETAQVTTTTAAANVTTTIVVVDGTAIASTVATTIASTVTRNAAANIASSWTPSSQ